MRGSFDSSCGVTSPAFVGAVASPFVAPETAAGAATLVPGEFTEDEVTEDEANDVVVSAGCFAAVAGLVIFGSGRTIASPSCAFFSFHHSPPASTAETTTSTNTSTMPG